MKVSEKPKSRNMNEDDEKQGKLEEEEVRYEDWLPSKTYKKSKL